MYTRTMISLTSSNLSGNPGSLGRHVRLHIGHIFQLETVCQDKRLEKERHGKLELHAM